MQQECLAKRTNTASLTAQTSGGLVYSISQHIDCLPCRIFLFRETKNLAYIKSKAASSVLQHTFKNEHVRNWKKLSTISPRQSWVRLPDTHDSIRNCRLLKNYTIVVNWNVSFNFSNTKITDCNLATGTLTTPAATKSLDTQLIVNIVTTEGALPRLPFLDIVTWLPSKENS